MRRASSWRTGSCLFSIWLIAGAQSSTPSLLFNNDSTPSTQRFHNALDRRLGRMWNGTDASVKVVASSPGSWSPSIGCASPRLFIFLYGHYRAMWTTERYFKEMGSRSTNGDCFLVSFAGPPEVDSRKDNLNIYTTVHKKSWPREKPLPSASTGVPALLAESSLGGHIAYAVLQRTGVLTGLPMCLALYWHSVWAVTEASAAYNGFPISPEAVVLRTRPDVLLRAPQSLGQFTHYVERGKRGRHVVLGNEMEGFQGDIYMTTSFTCYENDIARPIEQGMRQRREAERKRDGDPARALGAAHAFVWLGMVNGWGFGRSARLYQSNRALVNRLLDGCICLDGRSECPSPSCLVTNVESGAPYANNHIVRVRIERHRNSKLMLQGISRDARKAFNQSVVNDPANRVHVYCPVEAKRVNAMHGFSPISKPCFDGATFGLDWTKRCHFLRSETPSTLNVEGENNGSGVWPSWCEITGKKYTEATVQLNQSAL
jgi:hypothetical protein